MLYNETDHLITQNIMRLSLKRELYPTQWQSWLSLFQHSRSCRGKRKISDFKQFQVGTKQKFRPKLVLLINCKSYGIVEPCFPATQTYYCLLATNLVDGIEKLLIIHSEWLKLPRGMFKFLKFPFT